MTATIQPESKSPSRRALLAGALGGIGAWAASAIGRASPVRAAGDDLQIVHVGDTYLDVRTGTYLSDKANNNPVLSGVSSSELGFGGGTGIAGVSGSGIGVHGTSDSNVGVNGTSISGSGVWGNSSSYVGVFGDSSTGIGVQGNNFAANHAATVGWAGGNSTGVQGYSGSALPVPPAKTGVYGYAAQDAASVGVRGESPAGFGVYGKTTGTGFAGYFNGKVYMTQFLEMVEIATPASPAANKARLFIKDNALGKTQLVVKFANGSVKVLATES